MKGVCLYASAVTIYQIVNVVNHMKTGRSEEI